MKFAQKIIICMVVIVVLIFPVNSIAHENSSRLLFADKGKHDDKGDREARERLRGEGKSERKHMKEERKAHKKAKKEARKEKRRHMKEEGQARRENMREEGQARREHMEEGGKAHSEHMREEGQARRQDDSDDKKDEHAFSKEKNAERKHMKGKKHRSNR
jgi:chromatin assembly factor 1 subunit A